jgi:uncharacterized protein YwqG
LERLVEIGRRCGFDDETAIRRLARPAARLKWMRTSRIAPHGSRLGGLPLLPRSVEWPRSNGRSMAFIGQIDLAAQPATVLPRECPRSGVLTFFYDEVRRRWGFDREDAGTFAVVHVEDPRSAVVPVGWPEDLAAEHRHPACLVVSEEAMTLPPDPSTLVDELNLDEERRAVYQALLGAVWDPLSDSRGLLFGHPDQIQNDMALECAMVTAGADFGKSRPTPAELLPYVEKSREWIHLLQVPSSAAAQMKWGDDGYLYYWIRAEDLAKRRFENAWLMLQCT